MSEMDILFDEWKKQVILDEGHFVEDGIIYPEMWDKAERKVLYVLKETNGYKGNIAKLIHDVVRVRPKDKLWKKSILNNIGRWSYGLLNYKDEAIHYKVAHKNRKTALLSCAFINIKKTAGKRTATKAVEEHAEKYGHFLRRQIALLNPDIIVFGGTYEIIKQYVIPELSRMSPRIHKFENVICVNANHPSCTLKRSVVYERVIGSFDFFAKNQSLSCESTS